MFEIYKILSTIVKYRTKDSMEWGDRCVMQIELINSYLMYLTACGIEFPPQEKEEVFRQFVDLFYFFEKFLEEAKNVEK